MKGNNFSAEEVVTGLDVGGDLERDETTVVVHHIRAPDVGLADGVGSDESRLGNFEEGSALALGRGSVSDLPAGKLVSI